MSRELRRAWRRFYGALVEQAHTLPWFGQPKMLITSVLDGNKVAVRYLTQMLKEVRYVPLQRTVSITAMLPTLLARRSVDGITIRKATMHDLSRLRGFLSAQTRNVAMTEHFERNSPDELTRRFEHWQHFDIHNFIIAERNGAISATVAPRCTESRTMVVGLGAQLRRSLKLLYLTHLEVERAMPADERAAVIDALAHFVWREVKRPSGADALCLARFPDFEAPLLRGWVAVRTPSTLYQVVSPDSVASPALVQAAKAGPLPYELSIA